MSNFNSWETELYHHGILGMKWGIRRFQNRDGTRTPEGKKQREKTDRALAREQKRQERAETKRLRNPKNLSDDELRQRVARLELEKRYRELNTTKLGRTVDYIRKYNKERSENKERRSKLIAAQTAKKTGSIWYKVASKLAGSVAGAVGYNVEKVIKKSGDTLADLLPDAEAVKKGAKWVISTTPNAAKSVASGAKKTAKSVASKAKKAKKNAVDSYYDRKKRKASKDNPWTW